MRIKRKDGWDDEFLASVRRLSRQSQSGTADIVQAITDLEVILNEGDFGLRASRGLIPGVRVVGAFGRAPNGIQTTATDIWDRADAAETQRIWVAPTAARVHAIVSTSASDDGSPPGVGARTVTVYGLESWSQAETSETVVMNGTSPVNTVNSYVMINRLSVATSGNTSMNVGTITATAAVDGTVTAAILPGEGESHMAIYGVPSGNAFYMSSIQSSFNRSSGAPTVDTRVLVNDSPATRTTYRTVGAIGLTNSGTTIASYAFDPPRMFPGPCIIKVQSISDTLDTDGYAFFGGYLI